ncbi:unnamed protein product [Staurois parvus]|uniref:Uncharacterized protein n=1 Tax=Staurois parvus TaxID=386267 RepID=A0ABN9DIE4_9NEOB|nr:unnamed protein product [Staurois parvus]
MTAGTGSDIVWSGLGQRHRDHQAIRSFGRLDSRATASSGKAVGTASSGKAVGSKSTGMTAGTGSDHWISDLTQRALGHQGSSGHLARQRAPRHPARQWLRVKTGMTAGTMGQTLDRF